MDAAAARASYRAILRELTRSNSTGRRNQDIVSHIRAVFRSPDAQANPGLFQRSIGDVVTFMRSQKMYNALLERYNPTHGMSQEERVQATARRVGLDMPVEEDNGKGPKS